MGVFIGDTVRNNLIINGYDADNKYPGMTATNVGVRKGFAAPSGTNSACYLWEVVGSYAYGLTRTPNQFISCDTGDSFMAGFFFDPQYLDADSLRWPYIAMYDMVEAWLGICTFDHRSEKASLSGDAVAFELAQVSSNWWWASALFKFDTEVTSARVWFGWHDVSSRVNPAPFLHVESSGLGMYGFFAGFRDQLGPTDITTATVPDSGTETNILRLLPEYDYKCARGAIQTQHRTPDGHYYSKRFAEYCDFRLNLKKICNKDGMQINSWWGANTDLLFTDNYGATWNPVQIANSEKPVSKISKPYGWAYDAALRLERY